LAISTKAADGFLYHLFGNWAWDDQPGQKWSYQKPAITVNNNGDMVIVICRALWEPALQVPPDVRYIVYYGNESTPRSSTGLKQGLSFPFNSEGEPLIPQVAIDFQTAVLDAADDHSAWIAALFANANGGYSTVVGAITP
jgi:hypothetical protein